MGYLTTITFSNDAGGEVMKDPKLPQKIHHAMVGVQRREGRKYDSIGYHGNGMIIQSARHADSHTLYLHAGNTVKDLVEIDSNESEGDKYMLNAAIEQLEHHLERLKKLKK